MILVRRRPVISLNYLTVRKVSHYNHETLLFDSALYRGKSYRSKSSLAISRGKSYRGSSFIAESPIAQNPHSLLIAENTIAESPRSLSIAENTIAQNPHSLGIAGSLIAENPISGKSYRAKAVVAEKPIAESPTYQDRAMSYRS